MNAYFVMTRDDVRIVDDVCERHGEPVEIAHDGKLCDVVIATSPGQARALFVRYNWRTPMEFTERLTVRKVYGDLGDMEPCVVTPKHPLYHALWRAADGILMAEQGLSPAAVADLHDDDGRPAWMKDVPAALARMGATS